ncbi:MAG: hypothetical protein RL235_86 [Chlamydiota bacterium]|jgi:hypothetical protein
MLRAIEKALILGCFMLVHFFASLLLMAQPTTDRTAKAYTGDSIQVLPVAKTPVSNTVMLAVAFPQQGAMLNGNKVWVQFRVDGYALGAGSPFERASEINQSNMGQTVHVIVDDRPYFAVNEPAIDPFNEEGYFYDTSYKFELPFTLGEGMHTIRMFPARSFGESVKKENTYFATYFYVGKKVDNPNMNLRAPYLTYNEPGDQIPLDDAHPILLDFYISNCELSEDGYKVNLSIDGQPVRMLTTWQPYYLFGIKPGKHTVRLELFEPNGKRAPGLFNDVTRTIRVQKY